ARGLERLGLERKAKALDMAAALSATHRQPVPAERSPPPPRRHRPRASRSEPVSTQTISSPMRAYSPRLLPPLRRNACVARNASVPRGVTARGYRGRSGMLQGRRRRGEKVAASAPTSREELVEALARGDRERVIHQPGARTLCWGGSKRRTARASLRR